MEIGLFFKSFGKINLSEVSEVVLAREIRAHLKCDLRLALNTARMVKEAHRLGVIRGNAVNTKS